jgi:hypothetical protein
VIAERKTLEWILFQFLDDIIPELTAEAINDGELAKTQAEDETGIVFSYPHMQFEIYYALREAWIKRKEELKIAMLAWGARAADLQAEREELARQAEAERKEREERKRLEALCREMLRAENETRKFYREEMKLCLMERRALFEEEKYMRAFLKAESAAAQRSKYDVMMSSTPEESEPKQTKKEARREQIKRYKVEKARLDREHKDMNMEDDLSHAIRAEEIRLRQIKQLEEERAMFGSDDDGDDDGDPETDSGSEHEGHVDEDDDGEGKEEAEDGPDEQLSDHAKKKMSPEERKAAALEAKKKERAKRKLKALKKARRELQAGMARELADAEAEAMMENIQADLEAMDREEESKLAEKEYNVALDNARKIGLRSQIKGSQEMKVTRDARKKRQHAIQCADRFARAERLCEHLTDEEETALAIYRRVLLQTSHMDSGVMHVTVQRFLTKELYEKLHLHYFRIISYILANRSEIVCVERKMMHLNEKLQKNQFDSANKVMLMNKCWLKETRLERLRMKRLDLGRLLFGKWQRRILMEVFAGWVRFWTWRLGIRNAYNLRYGLIKQGKDIARLPQEMSQSGLSSSVSMPTILSAVPSIHDGARARYQSKNPATNESPREGEPRKFLDTIDSCPEIPNRLPVSRTKLASVVKRRRIQCRNCRMDYIEEQNHNVACPYHSGSFEMLCPKSCSSRNGGPVTAKCMAHRLRRWSCCDNTEEGMFGRNGCCSRMHMPPREDPTLKKFMQDVQDTIVKEDEGTSTAASVL